MSGLLCARDVLALVPENRTRLFVVCQLFLRAVPGLLFNHQADRLSDPPGAGDVVNADGELAGLTILDAARDLEREGRIMTFPWTGDATGQTFLSLHRVVSEDNGDTWGEPAETNVPGQTSFHVDLPGGLLALVYSWRESETPGIYVALSDDDGFTWDLENQIQVWDAYGNESLGVARTDTYPSSHDNIAFGAPHITRLSNGDILASFWAGMSGQMVCRWSRLRVT